MYLKKQGKKAPKKQGKRAPKKDGKRAASVSKIAPEVGSDFSFSQANVYIYSLS